MTGRPDRVKHTASPWDVTSDGHYVSPAADHSKIVALIFRSDTDEEGERQANARLIAAAPELYEACAWLKEYAEVQVRQWPDAEDTPRWQSMLAALAKTSPDKSGGA